MFASNVVYGSNKQYSNKLKERTDYWQHTATYFAVINA